MCSRNFLWILLLIPFFGFSQSSELEDLLQEAKEKLYSQPEQTAKISNYILSQTDNPKTTSRASLLLAKSFYVRGNYSESIKHGLESQKLSDDTDDVTLKTETKVFAIGLLQELGLTTVVDKLWNEVTESQTKGAND